jgi:CheY-like chemotaxis protein
MDYEMPVMNGPTAAKRLREMGCDSYILGVTGNVMKVGNKRSGGTKTKPTEPSKCMHI